MLCSSFVSQPCASNATISANFSESSSLGTGSGKRKKTKIIAFRKAIAI